MSSEAAEIARIRAEYQRRGREIPPGYYGWSKPVNRFFHCQTWRAAIEALAPEGLFPLDGKRVADIGCGAGTWLVEFVQWGARSADLAGIDLDPERIETARGRLAGADLRAGDAQQLPWPDGAFDLATQFTVFTSVLDAAVKRRMAAEMLRVLKPGGAVLWYDFFRDNPRNPHVQGIGAAEIAELFPGCRVKLRRATLAPPLARAVVPVSWTLALVLEAWPFLRTHYLAVIRKQHG